MEANYWSVTAMDMGRHKYHGVLRNVSQEAAIAFKEEAVSYEQELRAMYNSNYRKFMMLVNSTNETVPTQVILNTTGWQGEQLPWLVWARVRPDAESVQVSYQITFDPPL